MTYPKDSLERFATAACADLNTWPQLLPFGQLLPEWRPSRHFVVAVSISIVIHAFLAFLLWAVAADRVSVEPTGPIVSAPLIVSLVSLSTDASVSHDGPDREAVSAVPHTSPPAQHSEPSPERSHSTERGAEAETVATSKDQVVPDSVTPGDTSPATDPEAAYRISREVGRMPMSESETAPVVASKGQGVPASKAPGGKSLGIGATPSINLEAAYRIAQEVGREWASMSELKEQSPRFRSRELYLKNHLGITMAPRPDCRTKYAERGFLAIPYLLKDSITDSGCEWKRQEDRERERDQERKSGREFLMNLTNTH